MAMDLVRRGWQVILPARIKDRVADVVAFAGQIGAPPPLVLVCDLADHVQVRALCDEIAAAFRPNVVVNCAGVGGGVDVSVREVNPRGVELRMAVNAATPHIIARLLAPVLADGGRIVQVGSMGQAPIALDDLNFTRGYDGIQAYCRSKLAVVMSAFELAREGIAVNVVHPANEMPTRMVAEGGFPVASTLDDGVLPVLRAALDSKIAGLKGAYLDRFEVADPHPQAFDGDARRAVVGWLDAVTAPGYGEGLG